MSRAATTTLALFLLACVPADDAGDTAPAQPAVERPRPQPPRSVAPAKQKPIVARQKPKESLRPGEYYRYVDEFGRVRLASRLDDVPERQRSTVTRVEAPKESNPPSERVVTAPTAAHVVLYTTRTCPYCEKATKYLDSIGQDYVNWDVERDPEKQLEYLKLTHGRSGVPVIVVGDRWMQGWSREKLDELLTGASPR